MDAEVITLSRLLAVRTLQLEMEHVYRSLEDEALDIAPEELLDKGGPPVARMVSLAARWCTGVGQSPGVAWATRCAGRLTGMRGSAAWGTRRWAS